MENEGDYKNITDYEIIYINPFDLLDFLDNLKKSSSFNLHIIFIGFSYIISKNTNNDVSEQFGSNNETNDCLYYKFLKNKINDLKNFNNIEYLNKSK
jgi:hypothetical protein